MSDEFISEAQLDFKAMDIPDIYYALAKPKPRKVGGAIGLR